MMNDFSKILLTTQNINDYYKGIKNTAKDDINFAWLGVQDYKPVLMLQKKIHKDNIEGNINDVVLLLEHNHVYTLGKNANRDHILPLKRKFLKVVKVDRGGDVTYHGPGQLIGYPILDLNKYNKSVTWYIDLIQESIITLLESCQIKAFKKKSPFVGVWTNEEKIAAIGVRLSRWVSMHGFSININTNLDYYNGIIPCGIFELGITSLKELTDKEFDIKILANKMSKIIKKSLEEVFVC